MELKLVPEIDEDIMTLTIQEIKTRIREVFFSRITTEGCEDSAPISARIVFIGGYK